MERRDFIAAGTAAATVRTAAAAPAAGKQNRYMIAEPEQIIWQSPDPANVYSGTPGICRLASGRLVAVHDVRGKVPDGLSKEVSGSFCRILTSDDGGRTWLPRADRKVVHQRPFEAGGRVWVLGHSGDLWIFGSEDGGETWDAGSKLTDGQRWHQSACNVHYADGRVWLVMERNTDTSFRGWAVSRLAPVLMDAPIDADLSRPESWRFATELSFQQAVDAAGPPRLLGAPFLSYGRQAPENPKDRRDMAPMGWLETNVVQFTDPRHVWHDPRGKTFHLWMRAHTGGVGLACIAKVSDDGDGRMVTSLETAPSGEPMLYVPCPGGQMRFHVTWDEQTRLYWLLSTQATDSMCRADQLPDDRYNLPNNERQRLQLHFSTNMMDWRFAGLVAVGETQKCSRHYAAMCLDGDALRILSRSGDVQSKSAHDGDLVTFHTVPRFRELVY